jgi:mRNA interferase HicA
MKRHEFLRHLRVNGCILKREGAKHSLYMNPINGVVETVPRHVEIDNRLARKICNRLGIPEP